MNLRTQFIILGLIDLSLIISLFFIHEGLYTMFALVTIFVIAIIMFMFKPRRLMEDLK